MVITAFDLDAAKGLSSSSPFDPQKPLLQIGYRLFQANQFLPVMHLATSIYNHGKSVKIVSIIVHHHCILFLERICTGGKYGAPKGQIFGYFFGLLFIDCLFPQPPPVYWRIMRAVEAEPLLLSPQLTNSACPASGPSPRFRDDLYHRLSW